MCVFFAWNLMTNKYVRHLLIVIIYNILILICCSVTRCISWLTWRHEVSCSILGGKTAPGHGLIKFDSWHNTNKWDIFRTAFGQHVCVKCLWIQQCPGLTVAEKTSWSDLGLWQGKQFPWRLCCPQLLSDCGCLAIDWLLSSHLVLYCQLYGNWLQGEASPGEIHVEPVRDARLVLVDGARNHWPIVLSLIIAQLWKLSIAHFVFCCNIVLLEI